MLETKKVNSEIIPLKKGSETTDASINTENYELSYAKIKEEIIEAQERELRLEEYSLTESDGDQWYAHKIYQQRVTRIDSLKNMPLEQREREIKAKVIHEIFSRTHLEENANENQPPINSSLTVIFQAETNLH